MKTVVVTGGTVRIGKAISERLRRDGWRVLATSHRVDSGADIVADLSEPMGAARLYSAALRILDGNPPDALVNNAALFVGDEAAVRSVGLEAPKKLTMMMAGREAGVGAVVNILDAAIGTTDTCASLAYREAKEALGDFTRSSAMTFAATLRVNGVAPGAVMVPTGVHEKAGEMLLERRPTADDVAAAVAYLLTAESTTGCIIPTDAGHHLMESVNLKTAVESNHDARILTQRSRGAEKC